MKAVVFKSSSDHKRSPRDPFDINGKFDREFGLPTQVKTTTQTVVYLADARAFYRLYDVMRSKDIPGYRLLVGKSKQEGSMKVFYSVEEYFISQEAQKLITGDLTVEELCYLHDGISMKVFPKGCGDQARFWVANNKPLYEGRSGVITINPKIGSNGVRRIQCSVSLTKLQAALDMCEPIKGMDFNYRVHTETIGSVVLPLKLESEQRKLPKWREVGRQV